MWKPRKIKKAGAAKSGAGERNADEKAGHIFHTETA